MNANVQFVVYRILIATAIGVVAYVVAMSNVSIKRSEFLGSIVDASGVIVTIFGIWVAIIYPNFVAALSSGKPINKTPDSERHHRLIKSLYRSSFVLCSAVLLFSIFSSFSIDKETPLSRGGFLCVHGAGLCFYF